VLIHALLLQDMKDQASDFLPLVLKSVTSSMRRSHRTSSGRLAAFLCCLPALQRGMQRPGHHYTLLHCIAPALSQHTCSSA
jgi:hypothetical protein